MIITNNHRKKTEFLVRFAFSFIIVALIATVSTATTRVFANGDMGMKVLCGTDSSGGGSSSTGGGTDSSGSGSGGGGSAGGGTDTSGSGGGSANGGSYNGNMVIGGGSNENGNGGSSTAESGNSNGGTFQPETERGGYFHHHEYSTSDYWGIRHNYFHRFPWAKMASPLVSHEDCPMCGYEYGHHLHHHHY